MKRNPAATDRFDRIGSPCRHDGDRSNAESVRLFFFRGDSDKEDVVMQRRCKHLTSLLNQSVEIYI